MALSVSSASAVWCDLIANRSCSYNGSASVCPSDSVRLQDLKCSGDLKTYVIDIPQSQPSYCGSSARQSTGRGVDLPARQTRHQCIYLAFRRKLRLWHKERNTSGLSCVSLDSIRHDLLGSFRSRGEPVAGICPTIAKSISGDA